MTRPQPDGYLALPPDGKGAPVLVLHAWWGLNEALKKFCDRLAGEGFVVFAPDIYHGQVADTIEGAETLAHTLLRDAASRGKAGEEVTEAGSFLLERAGAQGAGLAIIGFSLGAFFALDASERDPDRVHSVVSFYGTRPGDYSDVKADYLGHFAEHDQFEPQAEVDSLEVALRTAGRPVTFHQYPGTGHWFFEPARKDAYDEAAAMLAWHRTLEFLKRKRT